MKNAFEISGRTITLKSFWNTDTFRIVKKIPEGFMVWNIGDNMVDPEWIPLCELLHPENKEDYSINPATLKAIKLPVDEVKALREAANCGIGSLKACKKALKSRKRGYIADMKRQQAANTLDIFLRIS